MDRATGPHPNSRRNGRSVRAAGGPTIAYLRDLHLDRDAHLRGLQLKHLDLKAGTIKIQQRHCRGDVDEPKTKNSKRTLALGTLTDRFKAWIAKQGIAKPDDWIFAQEE